MLECDDCGATKNSRGMPFRSEQGLLGHKQFTHGERAGSDAERADGRSAATQRQVLMGAYEDLEEDRDALRGEVEGLRASARQLKTTLAQAVREENERLRGELVDRDSKIVALQQEVEGLQGQVRAAQGRIPSHPPGLCQEATCEFCVAQAQEIAEPAYAKGREDLIAHIDEALVAVGGEPLRERVAAVLAQGHAIVERGKQEIVIVDDKGEPLPGEVVLQAVDKAVREAMKQAEPQIRAFLQQRQQVATVVP